MENKNKILANLSPMELALLEEAKQEGTKPVAASLAAQFYELFLEGFTCKEIAKQNPVFTEKDILFCREKYAWDQSKEEYAQILKTRIHEKLAKNKLETVEFITNMMSITHRDYNKQAQKYIQTGKEDDKPDTWIKNSSSYKAVVEILQKVTGEDKITKQKISGDININTTNSPGKTTDISVDLQSKILEVLAQSLDKKKND